MQRDRFEDAHKYLKRASELSPEDPLILMQYGVLSYGRRTFSKKRMNYSWLHMHLIRFEAEIIFYLAEVHAHLGLLRDAKAYAEKYIQWIQTGPFADESMEIIDFAEQEESFLDEDEDRREVYFLQEKARRLMESGDFNEAVELLESIITDYPEFWAAYNNLALAYFYIGKTKQASELLHDVLKRNKGNLHALCNLAVFYYYEKKEEELESLLELLVKIKPYLIEHRYKLGCDICACWQT